MRQKPSFLYPAQTPSPEKVLAASAESRSQLMLLAGVLMKPLPSHSRRTRIGAVCTLLLATQLAACGGGDDNNDAAPVPPPPAGNNPPPAGPTMASLTLSGKVTDAPIANAVVTATVGDETFT